MRRTEIVGYTSKKGITKNYKVIRTYKKDGKDRVKLQSFGPEPISFWVDRIKLVDTVPMKVDPNAPKRQCWECGCLFTWAEAFNNGGEWSEDYCGC